MSEVVRVLHVIGIMNRGGAESMLMSLYRNIDRSKIQFDFIEHSLEPAVFDEEIEALGGRIYRCPQYTGINHCAYKKWWRDFFIEHQTEYQIIHGHIGSTAAIYLKIAKENGLYTIAHSHSAGTDHSAKDLLFKILSFRTRKIADYFFACSKAAGIDRFGSEVTQGINYKVLNNAIDTKKFRYDVKKRNNVRNDLGLTNQILIGHIGRFTSEKNHIFILKVFKELYKLNDNCRLILIGDGPLRHQIEKQASDLGISNAVIFTGVRSDVEEFIQAMDLFLFPSIYEGLGIAFVEAQTSGLPCVISEKVPTEGILTENLVTIKNLEDTPLSWAEHILGRIGEERKDRSAEITLNGYDIAETAKWLGDFYINKYNKRLH